MAKNPILKRVLNWESQIGNRVPNLEIQANSGKQAGG
jgi:hypothetical protein